MANEKFDKEISNLLNDSALSRISELEKKIETDSKHFELSSFTLLRSKLNI